MILKFLFFFSSILLPMACLPTAGIIGSIVSGASGAFGTLRGLLPFGRGSKKKEIHVTNKNRRHSVTNVTNSHNRHRTSVETVNYFRNDYYGNNGDKHFRKTRTDTRGAQSGQDRKDSTTQTSSSEFTPRTDVRVRSAPAQVIRTVAAVAGSIVEE